MTDESYIRKLTESLADRKRADEEQTRKENREAEITKSEAPVAWMNLKTWLRNSAAQVNQAFPSEVLTYAEDGLDKVILRCNLGTDRWDLKVSFGSVMWPRIVAESTKKKGLNAEYDCKIEGRNLFWFDANSGQHERITVEEIGQRILDAAVKP